MKGREGDDTNFLLMSSRGLCSKDSCFLSQSDFVLVFLLMWRSSNPTPSLSRIAKLLNLNIRESPVTFQKYLALVTNIFLFVT